jgi:lipid II:glycine glycyltransferase (peptidoglycan interpeptide bridge formation enzyme)
MIEITDSPDREQWSDFVYNHPYGNIFQTPDMAEVYKRTKNYEPITLAATTTNNDEILAILHAVVIKEMKGMLGKFSARSIIQGGPLFIDNEKGVEALRRLMEYYDEIARKEALYTDIRALWDTSNISGLFNGLGYEYEEHLNFLIDLNRSEEEIWQGIHKSRRKGINRAASKGVKIEEMGDKKLVPFFYEIIDETYKHAKIPLADVSLFDSAFELLVPKSMAIFYLAKYENMYIGARAILNYKDLIYDWYAGALLEYLSLYINEALVWHSLKEGVNNGYHLFNFGGAGKPNEEYGVREFKRRFGGKMVNLGRYRKIYSPFKMKIAEKGFEVYKELHLRH